MALNTKTPMQIIQALSISKVNTRRISEATEHLARQRIVIERISEAKKVYEEQYLLSMGLNVGLAVCVWPGSGQLTFPATGH